MHRSLCRSLKSIAGVLTLGVIGLTSCAPGSNLTPIPSYNPTDYTIGIGDRIHVSTFNEGEFSADSRIPIDGQIDFPLIGRITAQGKTPLQLSHTISSLLQQKNILRDANVIVQVEDYRPISVIGEVQHGGQFAYQPNMTMLSAVAAAGGFTFRAFQGYAYVVRQVPGGTIVGKLAPQDYVKPSDVIKIYERHF